MSFELAQLVKFDLALIKEKLECFSMGQYEILTRTEQILTRTDMSSAFRICGQSEFVVNQNLWSIRICGQSEFVVNQNCVITEK